MSAPAQHHEIRTALHSRLLELAKTPDSPVQETLLIRDGCYCGQKFRVGLYTAVWFVEEAEVKIFGPSGTLVEAFRAESMPTLRAAA